MRKIILNVAVTLDGFIEGPDGELDWLVRDETIDFADILTEILSDKDAIFYGRVSYEKWGNFTPEIGDNKKLQNAYAQLHSKQKYVFSTTVAGDETDAVFINSDIEQRVRAIKAQPGKNIWLYGGAKLTTTLLNLNLIDEFRLAIHPVLIGKGRPLFQNLDHYQKLTLLNIQPHPSGVTLGTYATQTKT